MSRAVRRRPTTRSSSTRRPPTTRASPSAIRSRSSRKEAVNTYTLVGIATLGEVDSFGGATLTEFTLPEAQRITGKVGELDEIVVAAAEGPSPEQLAANLDAALPNTLEARTGAENVDDQREDVNEFVGFLKTALLIFAGVSLFVAAFLIFNTFSITVAQRTREFAMLRTLGASRRQILTTVIAEAFIIGFLAAAVGVGLGHRLRLGDQVAVRGARHRSALDGHRDRASHDHRRARPRHRSDRARGADARRFGRPGSLRSPGCARAR